MASADSPVAQWELSSGKGGVSVAADSAGNVWILCSDHVEKFNSNGEYQGQFGEEGPKEGQFGEAEGISTDSAGHVWVANSWYGNVMKFDSSGEFLDWFGNPFGVVSSHGDGEFDVPRDVAVDSAGDVWAVDRDGQRLEKFHFDGEKYKYVEKFGNVQKEWEEWGDGDGEFNAPVGIAIDSAGNLWVVDSGNNRVQKFNSNGEYLGQFGSEGSGNGQFKLPTDIAIDSAGNIWIADYFNARVQKFNPEGEYLGQFGKKGKGSGEFKGGVQGLAIDSGDNLWIVAGGQLQKWAILGKPAATSEAATDVGLGAATLNARVNPEGSATTYHFEYDTSEYKAGEKGPHGTSAPIPDGSIAAGTSAVEVSQPLEGLAMGTTYHYRVVASNEGGTAYGEDKTFETTVETPIWAAKHGSAGTGPGQLEQPYDVAVDHEGDLWVSDDANHRVQKLTPSGQFLLMVGKEVNKTKTEKAGTSEAERNLCTAASGDKCGKGTGAETVGIAIDPEGDVWVAESTTGVVKHYSPQGAYLGQIASQGSGQGQINSPRGIAFDAKGNLLIADQGNNRIVELTRKGEFLMQFGTSGEGDGQFKSPQGVDVDAAGNIWVADTSNNRLQKFGSNGAFIAKYGSSGTANGKFSSPHDVEIDSHGTIWVADSSNDRIEAFNGQGKYLTKFGSYGTGDGQLRNPKGLAFDSNGGVWVTDTTNNRIQKWVFPSALKATTLCTIEEAGSLCDEANLLTASNEPYVEALPEAPLEFSFLNGAGSPVTVTCAAGQEYPVLAGKLTAPAGEPMGIDIVTWSLGEGQNCTRSTGGTCAAEEVYERLPYAGSLSWTEGADGALAIRNGGTGEPGWKFNCGLLKTPGNCMLSFEPDLSFEGGSPAQISIPETAMKMTGTGCYGSQAKIKPATYGLVYPSEAAYVARAEG